MAGAEIFPFPRSSDTPSTLLFDIPSINESDVNSALLINRLHRELEIDQLLNQFLREISQAYRVEGIGYILPETREEFYAGKMGVIGDCIRLHCAGDYLGELTIYSDAESNRSGIRQLVTALEVPLRNALAHYRLKQLACRDCLTQLGNRSDFDNAMLSETARAHRFGQLFTLLVVDIDHFKRVNDRHGHAVGDVVIRGVANEIKECLRTYDRAFRYGGEEFVVLLSQTNKEKALQIAERLRLNVEQNVGIDGYPQHNVSVSIGLAEFIANQSPSELFDRADRALYQAKGNGRNQVVSAL